MDLAYFLSHHSIVFSRCRPAGLADSKKMAFRYPTEQFDRTKASSASKLFLLNLLPQHGTFFLLRKMAPYMSSDMPLLARSRPGDGLSGGGSLGGS